MLSRRRIVGLVTALTLGMSGACSDGGRSASKVAPDGRAAPPFADGRGGGAPDGDAGAPGDGAEPVRSWRWTAPAGASVGLPTTDSGGIAFTFGHLRVALLDPDGVPRWEAERLGVREVAPLLTPSLVFVATDDGVMAVDRMSGAVRWDTRLGERANTPVLAAGRPVVSTWEGSLIALEPDTGQVAWRVSIPAGPLGPAAVVARQEGSGAQAAEEGTLATVAVTWESDDEESAGAVGVDAVSGSLLWETPLEPGGVSSPGAAGAGRLVVVAGDLAAHGLDAATGDQKWRITTDGAGSPEMPPMAPGDGTVVVAHRMAGLVVADSGGGALKWQATLDAAAVRGSPAGPGPAGRFALGLYDGNVLVAGPADDYVIEMPSPVSGLALGARGALIVSTAGGESNFVQAYSRW